MPNYCPRELAKILDNFQNELKDLIDQADREGDAKSDQLAELNKQYAGFLAFNKSIKDCSLFKLVNAIRAHSNDLIIILEKNRSFSTGSQIKRYVKLLNTQKKLIEALSRFLENTGLEQSEGKQEDSSAEFKHLASLAESVLNEDKTEQLSEKEESTLSLARMLAKTSSSEQEKLNLNSIAVDLAKNLRGFNDVVILSSDSDIKLNSRTVGIFKSPKKDEITIYWRKKGLLRTSTYSYTVKKTKEPDLYNLLLGCNNPHTLQTAKVDLLNRLRSSPPNDDYKTDDQISAQARLDDLFGYEPIHDSLIGNLNTQPLSGLIKMLAGKEIKREEISGFLHRFLKTYQSSHSFQFLTMLSPTCSKFKILAGDEKPDEKDTSTIFLKDNGDAGITAYWVINNEPRSYTLTDKSKLPRIRAKLKAEKPDLGVLLNDFTYPGSFDDKSTIFMQYDNNGSYPVYRIYINGSTKPNTIKASQLSDILSRLPRHGATGNNPDLIRSIMLRSSIDSEYKRIYIEKYFETIGGEQSHPFTKGKNESYDLHAKHGKNLDALLADQKTTIETIEKAYSDFNEEASKKFAEFTIFINFILDDFGVEKDDKIFRESILSKVHPRFSRSNLLPEYRTRVDAFIRAKREATVVASSVSPTATTSPDEVSERSSHSSISRSPSESEQKEQKYSDDEQNTDPPAEISAEEKLLVEFKSKIETLHKKFLELNTKIENCRDSVKRLGVDEKYISQENHLNNLIKAQQELGLIRINIVDSLNAEEKIMDEYNRLMHDATYMNNAAISRYKTTVRLEQGKEMREMLIFVAKETLSRAEELSKNLSSKIVSVRILAENEQKEFSDFESKVQGLARNFASLKDYKIIEEFKQLEKEAQATQEINPEEQLKNLSALQAKVAIFLTTISSHKEKVDAFDDQGTQVANEWKRSENLKIQAYKMNEFPFEPLRKYKETITLYHEQVELLNKKLLEDIAEMTRKKEETEVLVAEKRNFEEKQELEKRQVSVPEPTTTSEPSPVSASHEHKESDSETLKLKKEIEIKKDQQIAELKSHSRFILLTKLTELDDEIDSKAMPDGSYSEKKVCETLATRAYQISPPLGKQFSTEIGFGIRLPHKSKFKGLVTRARIQPEQDHNHELTLINADAENKIKQIEILDTLKKSMNAFEKKLKEHIDAFNVNLVIKTEERDDSSLEILRAQIEQLQEEQNKLSDDFEKKFKENFSNLESEHNRLTQILSLEQNVKRNPYVAVLVAKMENLSPKKTSEALFSDLNKHKENIKDFIARLEKQIKNKEEAKAFESKIESLYLNFNTALQAASDEITALKRCIAEKLELKPEISSILALEKHSEELKSVLTELKRKEDALLALCDKVKTIQSEYNALVSSHKESSNSEITKILINPEFQSNIERLISDIETNIQNSQKSGEQVLKQYEKNQRILKEKREEAEIFNKFVKQYTDEFKKLSERVLKENSELDQYIKENSEFKSPDEDLIALEEESKRLTSIQKELYEKQNKLWGAIGQINSIKEAYDNLIKTLPAGISTFEDTLSLQITSLLDSSTALKKTATDLDLTLGEHLKKNAELQQKIRERQDEEFKEYQSKIQKSLNVYEEESKKIEEFNDFIIDINNKVDTANPQELIQYLNELDPKYTTYQGTLQKIQTAFDSLPDAKTSSNSQIRTFVFSPDKNPEVLRQKVVMLNERALEVRQKITDKMAAIKPSQLQPELRIEEKPIASPLPSAPVSQSSAVESKENTKGFLKRLREFIIRHSKTISLIGGFIFSPGAIGSGFTVSRAHRIFRSSTCELLHRGIGSPVTDNSNNHTGDMDGHPVDRHDKPDSEKPVLEQQEGYDFANRLRF